MCPGKNQINPKNQLTGDHMTGKSLLPLVAGETEKVRDFAIAGYYGFSWSIITDEYSYIHWLTSNMDVLSKRRSIYIIFS